MMQSEVGLGRVSSAILDFESCEKRNFRCVVKTVEHTTGTSTSMRD